MLLHKLSLCLRILFTISKLLHSKLLGRMVSHFYGNGDVCDLTEKPRQVTVKLK